MDRLPFEICNFIFSLLDYKSCLECSLVSKHWYTRLQQSEVLLKTINCTSKSTHKVIKNYFQNNSQATKKVHTLHYSHPLSTHEMNKLVQLFPNIEEFQMQTHSIFTRSFSIVENRNKQAALNSEQTNHWIRLKRYRESSEELHCIRLLENMTLKNILVLDIDLKYISPMQGTTSQLIYLLCTNTQHLQSLTLSRARLSYDQLDILHDGCKHLTQLAFFHAIFLRHPSAPHIGYYDALPPIHYTPTPAPNTMRHWRSLATVFEGSIPLISYIAAKYKHLETLIITTALKDKRSQAHIMELSVQYMKRFTCDLVNMTPELLANFNQLNLDRFHISKAMDCERMLEIIAEKFKSSIKKLVIKSSKYTRQCFDYIKQLKNLEILEIELLSIQYHDDNEEEEEDSYYNEEDYNEEEEEEWYTTVSLNLLLNQLPKLRHLSIKDFWLNDIKQINNTKIKLETLKLMDCTITGKKQHRFLSTLLSSCLDLKRICLFCSLYDAKKKVRINLNQHIRLEKIDIWIKEYPILRYHGPDNEKCWYDVERDGQFVTYYPGRKKYNYFILNCELDSLFFLPQRYQIR